jgi:xanthine dehydrogenase iron-sulfur cluster and FAD-binding subunit A
MLAHGIRTYHRPGTLEAALDLRAAGHRVLAGGTRLLATAQPLDTVVDLCGIPMDAIEVREGDLHLGATATLQDVIDSPLVHDFTGGLLPEACRAWSASRMLRGMATVGGEAVHGAHDSEVLAALLVLNSIFVVRRGREELESPSLRFLSHVEEDLGDGLVTSVFIPGVPDGTALERLAVLPSAPAIVSCAVALAWGGDLCTRARIALTGGAGPPARVLEAELRLEGTPADAKAVERVVEQVVKRSAFRDDAHASATYRKRVAPVLVRRAIETAAARARAREKRPAPRTWTTSRPERRPAPILQFGGGPLQVAVNGAELRADALPGTSLLGWLRANGVFGVKHGCETGECGACAVLLDGRPVNACLTLAARAHGREVSTVESLGTPDRLHPVQQAFVDTGAVQCGYCTPAMEVLAKALLDAVPDPTEAEVRDALAGCLCRCTGYVKPVQAVLQAARAGKEGA